MNRQALRAIRGLVLPLAVITFVAHAVRPLLPIDETRYLTVAWEMWLRGDFLVPHLNGELYSHKPPLLFWLFQLGWSVFGVNLWWPRLVPVLASLLALFLTARIAAKLFPDRPRLRRWAPRLAFATVFWQLFSTMVMFDFLVTVCSLLALDAVIDARSGKKGAWPRYALAIGLGILAKGPVILLYALPPALAAPKMLRGDRPPVWFSRLIAAILGGAAICLAWAIPAAIVGGPEYREAIFWGQTAGRMSESFAHARPIWWFLPLLPAMWLPVSFWPRAWQGWRRSWSQDHRVRFLGACFLPTFIAFSLVSGKQPHYLLPLFPLLALFLARTLEMQEPAGRRFELAGNGLFLVVLSMAYWFGPFEVPPWSPWILLAVGLLLLKPMHLTMRRAVSAQAGIGAGVLAFIHLTGMPEPLKAYDLQPLAEQAGVVQQEGGEVSYMGLYHGQLNFLGRLTRPVPRIYPNDIVAWARANPQGAVVVFDEIGPRHRIWTERNLKHALARGFFKKHEYALLRSETILSGLQE